MAVVEVDEEELRRLAVLRDTASKILNNPEAKLKLQEATKMVFPNAVTPELDEARNRRAVGTEISKKIDDLKAELAAEKQSREDAERLRKLDAEFEAGFDRLRKEHGYTAAGIEAVRKIMEEQGILNHDAAAAYYERLNPPQAPVTPNGRGGWDFMSKVEDGGADIKALIDSRGENSPVTDKMAQDALNEVRAARR